MFFLSKAVAYTVIATPIALGFLLLSDYIPDFSNGGESPQSADYATTENPPEDNYTPAPQYTTTDTTPWAYTTVADKAKPINVHPSTTYRWDRTMVTEKGVSTPGADDTGITPQKRQRCRCSLLQISLSVIRSAIKCATLILLVLPGLTSALRTGEGNISYALTAPSLIKVSGRTTTHSIEESSERICVRKKADGL